MGRPQDMPHSTFQRPSRREARIGILFCPAVSSLLPMPHPSVLMFFPPSAAWDPHLCELSKNLITSFVYSHDLVSRLSLGTMRDVSRAAVWLCKAEAEGRPEGYSGVTRRALRHKMGFGSRDDPIWVRLSSPQNSSRV